MKLFAILLLAAALSCSAATYSNLSLALSTIDGTAGKPLLLRSDVGGTVNAFLPNWQRRIYDHGNRALRVFEIGDSMGQAKVIALLPYLRSYLGTNFFGNTDLGLALAEGTVNYTTGTTNWFGDQWSYSSGAALTLTNVDNAAGQYCDSVEIVAEKSPTAGGVMLQTSTNNGAFVNVLGIGLAGTYGTFTTNFTVPLGWWKFRLYCTNGTVRVMCFRAFKDSTFGYRIDYVARSGGTLDGFTTTVATNVTAAVLQSKSPDLCFVEFKDDSNTFATYLPALKRITDTVTNMDVVLVGTSPTDTSVSPYIDTEQQNAVAREFARTNGWCYFDGYTPLGSYSNMARRFSAFDGTHPNQDVQVFLMGEFAKQSGMFANLTGTLLDNAKTGALASVFSVLPAGTNDPDGSLNQFLPNWASVLYSNAVLSLSTPVTAPLCLGSIGDSMVDFKIKEMLPALDLRYGTNGGAFPEGGQLGNYVELAEEFGTYTNDTGAGSTNWFGPSYVLGSVTTNGNLIYEDYYGSLSQSVYCDTIAAYYECSPSAGGFVMESSTNGAAWVVQKGVSANGTYRGEATNVTFAVPGYYRLRIRCTNGAVRIFSGGLWNSKAGGVRATTIGHSGGDLGELCNISTNVTIPIFRALNLTSLLVEYKDGASGYATNLARLKAVITNAMPRCDVILAGTTPTEDEATWGTVAQNIVAREFARTNGWTYLDFWTWAGGSYYAMTNRFGPAESGVHPSASANAYIANEMLRRLGMINIR